MINCENPNFPWITEADASLYKTMPWLMGDFPQPPSLLRFQGRWPWKLQSLTSFLLPLFFSVIFIPVSYFPLQSVLPRTLAAAPPFVCASVALSPQTWFKVTKQQSSFFRLILNIDFLYCLQWRGTLQSSFPNLCSTYVSDLRAGLFLSHLRAMKAWVAPRLPKEQEV